MQVWPLKGFRRVPSRRARPLMICCLVLAVIGIAYMGMVLQLRRNVISDSEKQAANVAYLLAEETDRSFQSLDLVLTSTIAMLKRQGVKDLRSLKMATAATEVHDTLNVSILGLPHISNVTIIGADGRMLSRARSGPMPNLDFSHRDYFAEQRTQPEGSLFISKANRSIV